MSKIQVLVDLEISKVQGEVEGASDFMFYGIPWSYGASFGIGDDIVIWVDNEVCPMWAFWVSKCLWLSLISYGWFGAGIRRFIVLVMVATVSGSFFCFGGAWCVGSFGFMVSCH